MWFRLLYRANYSYSPSPSWISPFKIANAEENFSGKLLKNCRISLSLTLSFCECFFVCALASLSLFEVSLPLWLESHYWNIRQKNFAIRFLGRQELRSILTRTRQTPIHKHIHIHIYRCGYVEIRLFLFDLQLSKWGYKSISIRCRLLLHVCINLWIRESIANYLTTLNQVPQIGNIYSNERYCLQFFRVNGMAFVRW